MQMISVLNPPPLIIQKNPKPHTSSVLPKRK